MTDSTLTPLISLAIFLGVTHTIMGPDHYIPFIAMARAGNWNIVKTMIVTFVCGLGHVLSSVVIGLVGVGFGMAVGKLEALESFRGGIAGWLLLGFGIAYTAYGIRQAIRNKPHTHVHSHIDGEQHSHEHGHNGDHVHVHDEPSLKKTALAIWPIFIIFVFGPCEVLIPQLMYPAARGNMAGVVAVASSFGIATMLTMAAIVAAGYYGLSKLPSMERYTHLAAGVAIMLCGVAIKIGL